MGRKLSKAGFVADSDWGALCPLLCHVLLVTDKIESLNIVLPVLAIAARTGNAISFSLPGRQAGRAGGGGLAQAVSARVSVTAIPIRTAYRQAAFITNLLSLPGGSSSAVTRCSGDFGRLFSGMNG